MLDRRVVLLEEVGALEDAVVQWAGAAETKYAPVGIGVGTDADELDGDGKVALVASIQQRRMTRLVVGLEIGAQGEQLGDGVADLGGVAWCPQLGDIVQGRVLGRVGLIDVEVDVLERQQLDDGNKTVRRGRV